MKAGMPNAMKDSLSGTFLYQIYWDGHCLTRGQLTNRTIWQMRKMSRKYKEKRVKKLTDAKSPVVGGFELMMQVSGNPGLIEQFAPGVLKACSDYFTYTQHFSFIKKPMFQSGIHLILIGWHLDDGSMRIKTTAVSHPKMLTDENLFVVANEFMATEAKKHPTTLPKLFDTLMHNDEDAERSICFS